MEKKFRLLLLLALLLTAATGARADGVTMKEITSSDIQSSWNGNTDPVKATDLPGFKAMTHDEAIALGAPSNDEKVYLIYAINASNKFAALIYESGTKSSSEAEFNLKELKSSAENYWVYYTYSAAAAGYTVSLKDNVKDADKWTITPTEATTTGVAENTEVTLQYNGRLKVKGVTATSDEKPAAPASTPLDNTTTAWTAGTFAVPAGGLTYSDAITVSGDVTLVLTDGTTLTLNKGISLAEGATLTIQGNGTMNINGTDGNTSSTVGGNHGTLVLTSGTLTARGGNGGSVGEWSEDSHGGAGGAAINGTVIVDGGTLTAKGGNGGNVGKWSEYSHGGAGGAAISGSLTINAGTVTTTNGAAGSVGEFCEDCSGGAAGKAVAGTVTDKR